MLKRLSRAAALVMLLTAATWCAAADFSADVVTKQDKMTITGKVYRQGKNVRQETAIGGQKRIIIVRPDKKVNWMLDPTTKTYMEMRHNPKMKFADIGSEPAELAKLAVKKNLGTERVNGILCEKSEFIFKNKSMGTMTQWYSKQLQWPIKIQSKSGARVMTMDYKNIRTAPLSRSLFEVPKGYKKTTMPKMPPMTHKGMPGR